jgi:fusion and transport protein UGO1
MTTRRDGVNPLRPYYVPPSIGEPSDLSPSPSLPNPFRSGVGSPTNGTQYASKARDIFTDLDYKGYIGEAPPSLVRTVKELVDDMLWKYTSALMAQPFEVAKTVMQVYSNEELVANPTPAPGASRHGDSEWAPDSRYRVCDHL